MPSIDTILQFITAALLAWVAFKSHATGRAVENVHLALNSRLDQLLTVTKQLANRAGRDEVLAEQEKVRNE